MANFLRFLLALAALPFAWGVARTVPDAFALVSAGDWSSPDTLAFAGGFALFLIVWFVLPAPVRLYVLGHELTHAVWGLAFGARVSGLRVGRGGGSVLVSKSNVWITLAPYFFPFWTMLVVLAAGLVRIFVSPLPCMPAWFAAVGFTWCFHVCFTLRTLMQTQPDVMEYGRLFSWTFIFTANLLGVLAGLVCVSEATFAAVGTRLGSHVAVAYGTLYGLVRSLPFLPR